MMKITKIIILVFCLAFTSWAYSQMTQQAYEEYMAAADSCSYYADSCSYYQEECMAVDTLPLVPAFEEEYRTTKNAYDDEEESRSINDSDDSGLARFGAFLAMMLSLAALYVYRPKNFKALPYLVIGAMLLVLFISDPDNLFVNRFYFKFIPVLNLECNHEVFSIITAIPVVTLLVMLIMRKIQDKNSQEQQ